MKRLLFLGLSCALALLWAADVQAQTRSRNIVYIDGAKYYIHTVEAGETSASIARLYGTSEASLLKCNPTAADGLKSDQTLKIPFTTPTEEGATPAPKPLGKKEEKLLKKSFAEHEVAQGETLYAISRKYEISVATLLEDNPEADPAHLAIGQTLRIRKKAIGRTDDTTAQAELEEYEEQLNKASAGDPYLFHVVQPKETIYSLARRYGMTEQELIALNHLEGGLKAGAILRIPNPEATPSTGAENLPAGGEMPLGTDSLVVDNADSSEFIKPREVELRALRPADRLQATLLLPLTNEQGKANANFAAFYQGFLLGLEDVKARGFSVDVVLHDTKRSPKEVERLLAEEESVRRSQLIVGPIYPEAMEPVLRYAEEAAIPVVSPLADLPQVESDVLFQMAPSGSTKYEKLLPLLNDPEAAITLIRTQKNDTEFEQEILALLGDRPYAYYNYESVQGVENAERSDLTPLLNQHDKHLFIVLPSGEVDVDRILASLASAQTNMQARSQHVPEFTVVGHSRWNRYTNIDRTTFFKDKVVLFSNFHAKRDSHEVLHFDKRYLRVFGTLPTLYAYRGYEVAVIFCPAMFSDIEYDMEGRRYHPLQTYYTFEQPEGRLSHINREWVKVTYNPNFTITIE